MLDRKAADPGPTMGSGHVAPVVSENPRSSLGGPTDRGTSSGAKNRSESDGELHTGLPISQRPGPRMASSPPPQPGGVEGGSGSARTSDAVPDRCDGPAPGRARLKRIEGLMRLAQAFPLRNGRGLLELETSWSHNVASYGCSRAWDAATSVGPTISWRKPTIDGGDGSCAPGVSRPPCPATSPDVPAPDSPGIPRRSTVRSAGIPTREEPVWRSTSVGPTPRSRPGSAPCFSRTRSRWGGSPARAREGPTPPKSRLNPSGRPERPRWAPPTLRQQAGYLRDG
jgi:hypothetical protein